MPTIDRVKPVNRLSKDSMKRNYLNTLIGSNTRNSPAYITASAGKHNDLLLLLDQPGVNEIKPKYNRSLLENQAYYSHSKPQMQ